MIEEVVERWLLIKGFRFDEEYGGLDFWFEKDMIYRDDGEIVSGTEILINDHGASVWVYLDGRSFIDRGSFAGRVRFSDPDFFVKLEELIK